MPKFDWLMLISLNGVVDWLNCEFRTMNSWYFGWLKRSTTSEDLVIRSAIGKKERVPARTQSRQIICL
jgi:hypothetical protein